MNNLNYSFLFCPPPQKKDLSSYRQKNQLIYVKVILNFKIIQILQNTEFYKNSG